MPKPNNHNIIGTQWDFRNKLDKHGVIDRNEAYLVSKGYNQEEGIDYDEMYARVARIKATRKMLLAYACVRNFKLFEMDVKNTFLVTPYRIRNRIY